MLINRALYIEGKDEHLSDDIDFSSAKLDPNIIRSIDSCHVEVDVSRIEDIFRVNVNLKAHVTLVCAYTLEDVPYVLKGSEEFDFVDEKEDESDTLLYEKNVSINMDPYIFSLLMALVPNKVIKKGAKLPNGGEHYRVISEDTYFEEQENKVDHRWDVLDELDLPSNDKEDE